MACTGGGWLSTRALLGNEKGVVELLSKGNCRLGFRACPIAELEGVKIGGRTSNAMDDGVTFACNPFDWEAECREVGWVSEVVRPERVLNTEPIDPCPCGVKPLICRGNPDCPPGDAVHETY